MKMNNTPTRFYSAFLAAFLAAQAVYAFYNPASGRWLNRDPINEPGHRVLKAVANVSAKDNAAFKPGLADRAISLAEDLGQARPNKDRYDENEGINLYRSLGNSPINAVDPDGLTMTGGAYAPYVCIGTNVSGGPRPPTSGGGSDDGNLPPASPVPVRRHPPCEEKGVKRNPGPTYRGGTCPCSCVPIRCFDYEQCDLYIGAWGPSGPVRILGWVKHSQCSVCPEYRVR